MITTNIEITRTELKNWFRKEGFRQPDFVKGKDHVLNYWQGQPVSVKLIEKEGFDTYYKPAFGGALVVFDLSVQNNKLVYDCYCPIWLFGIWNKKVTFKENAGSLTKYRQEGFYIHERFKRFLESK